MDWVFELVDFIVTTLHFFALLFLAYGAYLAVYWKDLRIKPGQSDPERVVVGRDQRHLRIQRRPEGRQMRADSLAGDPAAAQQASRLQAQRPHA